MEKENKMENTQIDIFDELEKQIKSIALKIDSAKRIGNSAEVLDLKKDMYAKKIEQIDFLNEDIRISSTQTAEELMIDVANRGPVTKYATGTPLDKYLQGGIEVGTFVQLAGESFAGKTHFIMEILTNVSTYSEVMFFNFEMGDIRINERLVRSLDTQTQRKNFLINSRARNLKDIIKEITDKASRGVKFFAIDSKIKIEVPEESEDLKAYRKISSELSKLSQEKEIIIILINQMNEDDQKNNRLAFKGGGDQMYDTDIALFYMLHKENNKPQSEYKRIMYCRKNRTGNETLFQIETKLVNNKTIDTKDDYEVEVIEYQE